jgi:hypothetical protein
VENIVLMLIIELKKPRPTQLYWLIAHTLMVQLQGKEQSTLTEQRSCPSQTEKKSAGQDVLSALASRLFIISTGDSCCLRTSVFNMEGKMKGKEQTPKSQQ